MSNDLRQLLQTVVPQVFEVQKSRKKRKHLLLRPYPSLKEGTFREGNWRVYAHVDFITNEPFWIDLAQTDEDELNEGIREPEWPKRAFYVRRLTELLPFEEAARAMVTTIIKLRTLGAEIKNTVNWSRTNEQKLQLLAIEAYNEDIKWQRLQQVRRDEDERLKWTTERVQMIKPILLQWVEDNPHLLPIYRTKGQTTLTKREWLAHLDADTHERIFYRR